MFQLLIRGRIRCIKISATSDEAVEDPGFALGIGSRQDHLDLRVSSLFACLLHSLKALGVGVEVSYESNTLIRDSLAIWTPLKAIAALDFLG